MDLYSRSFDEDAPISSAAHHLAAAAARLAVSMVRSVPYLPQAVWHQFQHLLTVQTMWSLCLVLAGWLLATVIGGVIGVAVNALLLVLGLIELWDQITRIGGELLAWLQAAYAAQNDAELEVAAQHFAKGVSSGGITILEIVVTHRVFRAVDRRVRERFPTPDWLKSQLEEATRRRDSQRRPEPDGKPSTRSRNNTAHVVEEAGALLRMEGVKHVVPAFPTTAVVITGIVVALGAVATTAWVSTKLGKVGT